MTGNSAKVGEKSWKRSEVEEMLGNLCSQREIWLWQLDKMLVTKLWCELCMNCDVHAHVLRSSFNLPVLYSYCNSFFMRDVHGQFGLINVHLCDILPAISSRSRGFFCLESGDPDPSGWGPWNLGMVTRYLQPSPNSRKRRKNVTHLANLIQRC